MSQMAIDNGILDNSNLVPLQPAGKEAFRDIGLVYRATTSRRQTFRKIAEEIAKLLPVNTLNA